MIEAAVRGDEVDATQPEALAELIVATLYGQPLAPTSAAVIETGLRVREEQLLAEAGRTAWQDMETFQYETLDDADLDWTEI